MEYQINNHKFKGNKINLWENLSQEWEEDQTVKIKYNIKRILDKALYVTKLTIIKFNLKLFKIKKKGQLRALKIEINLKLELDKKAKDHLKQEISKNLNRIINVFRGHNRQIKAKINLRLILNKLKLNY